jgi:hypothetical protein
MQQIFRIGATSLNSCNWLRHFALAVMVISAPVCWSEPHDIAFFINHTSINRIFKRPGSRSQFNLLYRLWDRCLESEVLDLTLAPNYASDDLDWIWTSLAHPALEAERKSVLAQFQLIEKLAKAQNLDVENLSWEQVYQLADNFLVLKESGIEFVEPGPMPELAGVITKRNSLLAYDSSFVGYMFGRKVGNNSRTERPDTFAPLSKAILSAAANQPEIRKELTEWLDELRSGVKKRPTSDWHTGWIDTKLTSHFYEQLTNVEFATRLSPEAKKVLAKGTKVFRDEEVRKTTAYLKEWKSRPSAARDLYRDLREENMAAAHVQDLKDSGFVVVPASVETEASEPPTDEPAVEVEAKPSRFKQGCNSILSFLRRR